jgi:hypothetical protein
MGCATVRIGDAVAIVCSRGGGVKPCRVCGTVATKQCDHPTRPRPSRARCNAHVCDAHAIPVGPDLDWCSPCAEADAVLALA